jgi:hypothetical protein
VLADLRRRDRSLCAYHFARWGEDRFKILAKQVDRRIRLGPPLMQETINRLSAVNLNYSELEIAKEMRPGCPGQERAIEESPRNASETFKTS